MGNKFHERFSIEVGQEEARRRFVNRVENELFDTSIGRSLTKYVVTELGERYISGRSIWYFTQHDFLKTVQAVEALYHVASREYRHATEVEILLILEKTETDIGIRWENGKFIPSGARLLDDRLVNDVLGWLRVKGYENVLAPYQKGISLLLEAQVRPELLQDVITEMYEALEALAKNITGRQERDLSANRELFIKNIKASEGYKKLLSEYIDYANNFRHAAKSGERKPILSLKEVESFVYMTGIFIRLAMD